MELSKEYQRLFEIITNNEEARIPCFVDYKYQWNDEEEECCRDIATVRCHDGQISVGARGISYSVWDIKTLEHFIKDCKRMNLEYVD